MRTKQFSLLACFLIYGFTLLSQDIALKANEYMNALVNQQKFNGAVLVAKDNQVLFQKGYGYRDVEKKISHDIHSIFQIGSVTKQFTSAIIMQLHQENKLSVNNRISMYFPDFPRSDEITIAHLLAHTSGIYNYTNNSDFMISKVSTPHSQQQMIDLFKDKPLKFEPGSKYDYSNSGYLLLGYMIEKITGKTYEQVVRERILKPLGMNNTGFDFTHLKSEFKTTGYYDITDTIIKSAIVDSTVSFAAGALYSTTGDLYKWEQSLDGDKIMNAQSKKMVYSPVHNNYGYGWVIDSFFNWQTYSHGGGIHGFTSYLLRIANEKLVVILMDNSGKGKLGPIGRDLAAIALGKPYTVPSAIEEMRVDEKILQKYVGQYELAPNFILTVRLENGQLKTQATNQPEVDIYAEKQDKFFLKVVEAKIEFIKDGSGNIKSLILYQAGQKIHGKKIK